MTRWDALACRVWAASHSRAVYINCSHCEAQVIVWFEPKADILILHSIPECWTDFAGEQQVWFMAIREVMKRDVLASIPTRYRELYRRLTIDRI